MMRDLDECCGGGSVEDEEQLAEALGRDVEDWDYEHTAERPSDELPRREVRALRKHVLHILERGKDG